MSEPDIRWKQRFASYQKALAQLTIFIERENLNDLEKQGCIKSFEYTYELGWNLLKNYLKYQGIENIYGSRDAIRNAFNQGLIENGDIWMTMIKASNQTSHAYNQSTAQTIVDSIREEFFAQFIALRDKMQGIIDKAQDEHNAE